MASPRYVPCIPLVTALALVALAGCTTTDDPGESDEGGTTASAMYGDDVCPCFEGSPGASLNVTCEFDSCGSVRDPSDCSEGECELADVEASNAETVQCVLDLLDAGGTGRFGRYSSTFAGQFSSTRSFITHGDGTYSTWNVSHDDLTSSYSSIRVRTAPDAAALMPCTALGDSWDRWNCIEDVLFDGALLEECGGGGGDGPVDGGEGV